MLGVVVIYLIFSFIAMNFGWIIAPTLIPGTNELSNAGAGRAFLVFTSAMWAIYVFIFTFGD